MITIAVSVRGMAAKVALLDAGQLAEYSIWHFDQPGDIGDIFTGRITARIPAMAGSFVDLGPATGFLPDSAGAAGRSEGSFLTVEVTRCAQSGKGPRLAACAGQIGQKPGIVRQNLGPLAALANRYPAAPILIDDFSLIALIAHRSSETPAGSIAARLTYKAVTFDPVLEDEVAMLADPIMPLPGGARMHITPTPALTAIDIDAGAASADRAAKTHAQLSLNIALIPEIARQILLRNLSGAILIDFAGMKSSARQKLLGPLTDALKADPLNPRCVGFSNLGFAEISRPRIRPPLHEFPP